MIFISVLNKLISLLGIVKVAYAIKLKSKYSN